MKYAIVIKDGKVASDLMLYDVGRSEVRRIRNAGGEGAAEIGLGEVKVRRKFKFSSYAAKPSKIADAKLSPKRAK